MTKQESQTIQIIVPLLLRTVSKRFSPQIQFTCSPLSKATCCTYRHGLVSVTRKVSLSSVPANDLLSCVRKTGRPNFYYLKYIISKAIRVSLTHAIENTANHKASTLCVFCGMQQQYFTTKSRRRFRPLNVQPSKQNRQRQAKFFILQTKNKPRDLNTIRTSQKLRNNNPD